MTRLKKPYQHTYGLMCSITCEADKEMMFCATCGKRRKCGQLCQPLTNFLENMEYPKHPLELPVADPDLVFTFRGPLSLQEMETSVAPPTARHLPTPQLDSDDFRPVEEAGLSVKQKLVLYRHYWMCQSLRDIAAELRISACAVSQLLKRAGERLRAHLQQRPKRRFVNDRKVHQGL